MKRVPEKELMDDPAQVEAYARADNQNACRRFMDCFKGTFPESSPGKYVLDLGCGSGELTLMFAKTYPSSHLHAIDGSKTMLDYCRQLFLPHREVRKRTRFIEGMLPDVTLPEKKYDTIISNSLLHHLHHPSTLWETVKKLTRPDSAVFVMDLRRPQTLETAKAIVEKYAGGEPDIFKRDFLRSLQAAYTCREVTEQLKDSGLNQFTSEESGDRHLIVYGTSN